MADTFQTTSETPKRESDGMELAVTGSLCRIE